MSEKNIKFGDENSTKAIFTKIKNHLRWKT